MGERDTLAALLRDALDHIEALGDLCVALRVGGRTPEKALRVLDRTNDITARLERAAAGVRVAPSPDAPGLREAAIRVVDKRTADSDGFWISAREMRYLEEALALPPRDALDVERLARAMSKVAYPDPEDAWPNTVKDVKDLYRYQARAIVKAYEEDAG